MSETQATKEAPADVTPEPTEAESAAVEVDAPITDAEATSHADDSAGASAERDVVVTARNVCIEYEVDPIVKAVRNVDLTIYRGEILGLAGESGCGKTTLAYGINRLLKAPALMTDGTVTFHDKDGDDIDVLALEGDDLRAFRWDKVSMVFQGAMNSLNPVIKIRKQLFDVFTTHRPGMTKVEMEGRARELLSLVGVDPDRVNSYPHELSGGMRQRVMIAMALALEPQLMIMDEPTTALDVVVQRGIIREIMRLREIFGFAVIFITHDLPMLLEISDRVAVMKEGKIVERGTSQEIYTNAQHEYTKKLLSSFPSLTGERGAFVRGGEDQ
ncbi:ABC transporter ATP-binding protein [Demequina sp. B12]|uniref:ABC transporter ATP-binding protein n=1 Tax=Demequina sp. B12 TaxID=2992757 RepID=UPI00237ACD01|nr:ABC transporter ATP-binding protein [Demequina sp. B12]MDE0571937.1 ABC transporter ATP-binding protein [Demequina sp. B12]